MERMSICSLDGDLPHNVPHDIEESLGIGGFEKMFKSRQKGPSHPNWASFLGKSVRHALDLILSRPDSYRFDGDVQLPETLATPICSEKVLDKKSEDLYLDILQDIGERAVGGDRTLEAQVRLSAHY